MAKAKYESVMVISMKQGDDGIQDLIAKFKSLIEAHASLHSIDEWGKRKLAYLINKESEGYYVLYNFEAEPEFPAELDRVYKITDGVIRSLIVRKPEGEEFAVPQQKNNAETAKEAPKAEEITEEAPVAEETAEEAVEEVAETVEETVEETADQAEVAEETAAETAETVEETVEETAEETVEEATEETVEAAEEAVPEETAE